MNGDKIKIVGGQWTGEYPKENVIKLIAAAKKYGVEPNTLLSVALQESNFGLSRPDFGVNSDAEKDDRYQKARDGFLRLDATMKRIYGEKSVKQKKHYLEDWNYLEKGYADEIKDNKERLEYLKDYMKRSTEKIWRESYVDELRRKTEIENRKKEAEKSIGGLKRLEKSPRFSKMLNEKFGYEEEMDKIEQEPPLPPEERFAKVLRHKIEYGQHLGKQTEEELIQSFNGYGKIKMHENGVEGTELTPKLYGMKAGIIDLDKNPIYGKRVIDLRENIIKKNQDIIDLLKD